MSTFCSNSETGLLIIEHSIGEEGDNVVLSPACASWGMYPNYEVRGRDFKERVEYYGRNSKKS
jgi:UDP-N-acetylmuramoylalanine--D-glutamate ligase